jgi:transposase
MADTMVKEALTAMGKAYSVDLRERVLADYDQGVRPVELVRKYRVARSWIYKLIDQRRDLGHIAPLKGQVGPKPKLLSQRDQLRRLVAAHPDATLEELRAKLPSKVCLTTIWRALAELKLTLKKSHSRR